MNARSPRLFIAGTVGLVLAVWWVALAVTDTKFSNYNYWWQVGLSAYAIGTGVVTLSLASKWSWLKSGMGRAVCFISLGLIWWGIGQGGWSYYTLRGIENPDYNWMNVAYFVAIPLWVYGSFQLSRATGAKYALKSMAAKGLAVLGAVVGLAASWYVLVNIARGGQVSDSESWVTTFFDYGYAMGDVLLVVFCAVVFGLSWKILGGRFRTPIVMILLGFVVLYVSDLGYSYFDAKGQYFNGHWVDLTYLLTMLLVASGLSGLDPSASTKPKPVVASSPTNVNADGVTT